MHGIELGPLWLTLKLATVSSVFLLLIGTPLAWWLTHSRARWKTAVQAAVALPLVLPPTVLGFYLLIGLGPNGVIGAPWRAISGHGLAFTFPGLVVGSVLYSLPFVVQPLHNAFEALGDRWLEAAATLRASALDRFVSVVLPLTRGAFVTAVTLGFAHTVGEFGVVLMIGGGIPGKTQVVSIAIFDHVEALEYPQAHLLSAILLIFSFVALFAVYRLNRRWRVPGP